MNSAVIGAVIGVPVGWMLHTMYLRGLYKQMQFIRRQMHGGTRRKGRRH